MFDLDIIEKDWKENSFKLSEEEIIKIFNSEGATIEKWNKDVDEYKKIFQISDLTAEERLLIMILGDKEIVDKVEEKERIMRDVPYPTKKHLSKYSQNKVIEGSMDIVFNETRHWYYFFKEKISMETIYYLCLNSLMNSVKYMVHCGKPVFELYVLESTKRNIVKYISKIKHITYREALKFIDNITFGEENIDELSFYNYEEIPVKPSKIYYQTKDESYDIDYIKNISNEEFIKDYNSVLDSLDDISKMVMNLSFDINGYSGLTHKEIADYLGIDVKDVHNIKRIVIRKLRKNEMIRKHLL